MHTLMLLPQTKVSEIRCATSAYTFKTFSKEAFKISLPGALKKNNNILVTQKSLKKCLQMPYNQGCH